MSYTITSESTVLGKSAGASLTEEELAPYDIPSLIAQGHIKSTTPTKQTKEQE